MTGYIWQFLNIKQLAGRDHTLPVCSFRYEGDVGS